MSCPIVILAHMTNLAIPACHMLLLQRHALLNKGGQHNPKMRLSGHGSGLSKAHHVNSGSLCSGLNNNNHKATNSYICDLADVLQNIEKRRNQENCWGGCWRVCWQRCCTGAAPLPALPPAPRISPALSSTLPSSSKSAASHSYI